MKFSLLFAGLVASIGVATARALEHPTSHATFNKVSHPHNRSYDPDKVLLNPVQGAVNGLSFDITRFSTGEQWDRFVAKGNQLACLMRATDAGAGLLLGDTRTPPSAASPFSGGDLIGSVKKWGWAEMEVQEDDGIVVCDFEAALLKKSFEGLGLNPRSKYNSDGTRGDGENECIYMNHVDPNAWIVDPNTGARYMKPVTQQRYTVDGKEYVPTGAFYEFAINVAGGGIIAKNIESPSYATLSLSNWGRAAHPDELPTLRHASDIMWAYFAHNNPNVRNLRVYGAQYVINPDTVLLLTRAMLTAGLVELKKWPGITFDADSEGGRALIASPIGSTIAHMLIRHKPELGIKRIARITVATMDSFEDGEPYIPEPWEEIDDDPESEDINLFFQIEDVPESEVTEVHDGQDNARREVQEGVRGRGHGKVGGWSVVESYAVAGGAGI